VGGAGNRDVLVNREEIVQLYDGEYAAAYEAKFLTSELGRSDAEHELRLLGGWLAPGTRWLDVACGTGYFLRHFPDVQRAGLDLSPAMLARARHGNPGVPLVEGSYLDPHPEWSGAWDLVSCMWYAYGLVSSLREVELLVANIADWTAPNGRCFLPLADPRLILGVDFPAVLPSPWPGEVSVSGILWSYGEAGGTKVHAHQVAPTVEFMTGLLARHFEQVDLEVYPPAMPGWEGRRVAAVATGKLSASGA
jgi:SAM-dependent methyltransferase